MLPCTVLSRGAFVSGQQLSQEEVDRIVSTCQDAGSERTGFCESQVWGVPWTEDNFAQQMLKFSHPSTLQSCLPQALKDAVASYGEMSSLERMSYRASKLGYWLKVLMDLKGEERALKQGMDADVQTVLRSKNMCLWEAMLKALRYDDMGVVEEFRQGSELVGCVDANVFAALCVHVMSTCGSTEDWLGRTYDLVGAYRQCAVRPSSKSFAHIMVQHPGTKNVSAFRMRALPFGAVRSVHSFLRVATSIWFVMVKEFLVLTTNYFDDFVTLGTRTEASALTACIHMVFKLLRWDFAGTGPKAPEFSTLFQALDAQLDVSRLSKGLVLVSNTDGRRCELVEGAILAAGKLPKRDALRGRLQFAAGEVFGRIARSALAIITGHAYNGGSDRLSAHARLALKLQERMLEEGGPESSDLAATTSGSFRRMHVLNRVAMDLFLGLVQCSLTQVASVCASWQNSCPQTSSCR